MLLYFALFLTLSHSARAEPITRIAFGSCCHQDRPQLLWEPILATRPELFLLLGDNVYVDTRDPARFAEAYARLDSARGFQQLRESCRLLGTWDDHDYGWNDAGKEYPLKQESKQAFLEFFRVATDDPWRSREGIYTCQSFGPPGRRVQVIVLDTRWFRDPLRKDTRPPEEREGSVGWYLPHLEPGPTLLGEEQWSWLRSTLEEPAEVRLILSSIQFAAEGRGMECWANFPRERARMLDLIAQSGAQGVVFLSGDVHFAELSCLDGPYPIYDLTSSGLAHSTGLETNLAWSRSTNRHRVAGMVEPGPNFGTLEIDWLAPEPALILRAHTLEGRVSFQQNVLLRSLRPSSSR